MNRPSPIRVSIFRVACLLLTFSLFVLAWTQAGFLPSVVRKEKLLQDGGALRESRVGLPLAFSPDGRLLATSTIVLELRHERSTSPIRFLNTEDGSDTQVEWTPRIGSPPVQPNTSPLIWRAEYSPDGARMAVLQEHPDWKRSEELELIIFDQESGESQIAIPVPHSRNAPDHRNAIPLQLFSPDSRWLLIGDYPFPDRSVRVWDVANSKQAYELKGVSYPVVSPDSSSLVTTSYFRSVGDDPFSVQYWDIKSGSSLRSIRLQGRSEGWRPWPSFSIDGRYLAVNSRDDKGDQVVEVFENSTGQRVFMENAWSPQFLADGKSLMTVKDTKIQFWNIENWKLRLDCDFPLGTASENGQPLAPEPVLIPRHRSILVFSTDSNKWHPYRSWLNQKLGLNWPTYQQMTLVDPESGMKQRIALPPMSPTSNQGQEFHYILSPDGNRMAMASIDGSLSIWKLPPQKSFRPLLVAMALIFMALIFMALIFMAMATWSIFRRRGGKPMVPAHSTPSISVDSDSTGHQQ